jgi:4a-hydroxytetrahydrobiopterin dehydratase
MTKNSEGNVTKTLAPIALAATQIIAKMAQLDGWKLHGDGPELAIEKIYHFDSYLLTMAFVNAVAFVAEREDHHPEIVVQYKTCTVRFRTHDIGGISIRDFECATRVDALLQPN